MNEEIRVCELVQVSIICLYVILMKSDPVRSRIYTLGRPLLDNARVYYIRLSLTIFYLVTNISKLEIEIFGQYLRRENGM